MHYNLLITKLFSPLINRRRLSLVRLARRQAGFTAGSLIREGAQAEQAVDVSLILGQIAMGKKLPSEDGTIVTEVDEVSLLKQIAALTGLKEDEIKAMSPEEQMKLLENLKQGSAELGMVVTDSLEGAEVIAADEGDESEEDSAKLADTDDKAASKGDSKAEDETIDAPLLALDKAAATAEKAKSQEGEQQMGWPDADKSARKAATQDGMAAVVREAVLNAAEEKSDKILAQSAIADKPRQILPVSWVLRWPRRQRLLALTARVTKLQPRMFSPAYSRLR